MAAEGAVAAGRDYAGLRARVRSLCEGVDDPVALMATIACELYQGAEGFDWVGFYRVTAPEMLTIGPYQGGHGCLSIPFARGVCGAAARTERTVIVPDVEAFPDHIACAASTRSEIVLPVRNRDGQLIAVLDIDSDRPDAFAERDRAELEALLDETFRRPPTPPEPVQRQGLQRVLFEDDVFYGPVLLGLHLCIALFGWGLERVFSAPFRVAPGELVASFLIVGLMLVPVFLILRAYYHKKKRPLTTIFFMFGHAGLIVVGFAGIYGMLTYGPAGGFEAGAPMTPAGCEPSWERNLYMSAITFTTVGYGDCTPYGITRLFATMQGMMSVIFLGTTIGLMTGLAPAGSTDE